MAATPELLDDLTSLPQRDPDDMLGRIRELPEQVTAAWEQSRGLHLPPDYRESDRIAVFAMGGSAIGADLVRGLVASECAVPIGVIRGYDAPAYVNERTLAVASSYSGDTEETLTSFGQALDRGAKPVALTTGGTLLRLAAERGMPHHVITYKAMPRSALAHSLMPLLAVLQELGLVGSHDDAVVETTRVLAAMRDELDASVPAESNPAKQMALRLHGRILSVYGADFLAEVGRRWRGQFAENAKMVAFSDELPELNHNTVVGYPGPDVFHEHGTVVLLRSEALHPRVLLRYDATVDMLDDAGIQGETVEARGQSRLAQMMALVLFGDYVSFYLAMLNGADPTEVNVIARLKRRLAEAQG
jgi:glucose/mannose-6-phosphate isomerase